MLKRGEDRLDADERQDRLDVVPQHLPVTQPEAGTTKGGSLCLQVDQSVSSICELETIPRGHSLQCLQPELIHNEGLCQPSMKSDSPRD